MNTQTIANKYIEISSDACAVTIDTLGAATQRRLAYWKSVWDINARPYAWKTVSSGLQESSDRAGELLHLTADELSARVKTTADYSEKMLAQLRKMQDLTRDAYRESLPALSTKANQLTASAAHAAADIVGESATPADLATVSGD